MELLTPEEVSKLLKVNKRTIYYWIDRKMINHIRVNKKVVRFRPIDVEEFIQKHLVKASDVDEVVNEILSKLS
ncbi:helix-turn-helix domain-containing protein [Thermodesulfovibrio sp.]|uniref:helix-turn-helix domain-containing protein n=1 Tax=Thermodesulfovibrio sp. TaxID=2067987 RepID=UPI00309E329B